jgi:hypothetical protein
MLYTGSDDGHIKLYDIANATLLATLSGHTSWVLSVAFRCVNLLQPGLAIKNPPKKNQKTHPKKPLKMGFSYFKFLIFYKNNTNFSL